MSIPLSYIIFSKLGHFAVSLKEEFGVEEDSQTFRSSGIQPQVYESLLLREDFKNKLQIRGIVSFGFIQPPP